MLERIIRLSITHRWLVMVLALALAGLGVWNYSRLPIDATPDITNVQVQINTEAPGYSPLEAEQRITYPIETALAGLARLDYTRSISRYGLSQVTVVFEDGTDIYFARQQVAERLQQAKSQLPPDSDPMLGPVATGLGEIFMYTVESAPGATRADGQLWTPTDLRTLQDWEQGRRQPSGPRTPPHFGRIPGRPRPCLRSRPGQSRARQRLHGYHLFQLRFRQGDPCRCLRCLHPMWHQPGVQLSFLKKNHT